MSELDKIETVFVVATHNRESEREEVFMISNGQAVMLSVVRDPSDVTALLRAAEGYKEDTGTDYSFFKLGPEGRVDLDPYDEGWLGLDHFTFRADKPGGSTPLPQF